jgi:hypothetical protein
VDPDPISNKNQDPIPHQSDKLDPKADPHQIADDKPNVLNMRLFEYFFTFEPLFGS